MLSVVAAPDPPENNLFISPRPGRKYSAVPIQAILANQIPEGTSVGCIGFLGRIVNLYGDVSYYLYQDKSSCEAELTLNAIVLSWNETESEILQKQAGLPVQVRGIFTGLSPSISVIGHCAGISVDTCHPYSKPTR